MRYLLSFVLMILVTSFSYSQEKVVELWQVEQLQDYIGSKGDPSKMKVINFWATWCAPCIKELPYFEELNTSHQKSVDVLLVSLDFSDERDRKVIPFLDRKKIQTKVVILANEKYNEWIGLIDPTWTGAIPATLLITNDGKHHFYEREFERDELLSIVNKLKLKQNKP